MPAKRKATSKKAPAPPLPEEIAARMPSALTTRLPDLQRHEGMYAHGLRFRRATDRYPVYFDARAAFDVMSSRGEALRLTQTLVPLALVGDDGDQCFAVDPAVPELPVLFFEHEAGYHPFAPSLDAFLAGLLQKGVKAPLELLEKKVEKASALDEKKRYAAVIALLEPAVVGIPRVRRIGDSSTEAIGSALNLLGMAYRHTGQAERAVATLEEALAAGETCATLNLCSMYEERRDVRRSVAIAARLAAGTGAVGDMYEWFWAHNYLGRGHALLGEGVRAVRAYHAMKAQLEFERPEHFEKAKEGLVELSNGAGPAASIASSILAWFAPATAAVPDGHAAELVVWWRSVPEKARQKLAGPTGGRDVPSAVVLERLVRTSKLDLRRCGIADLAFLAPFRDLEELELKGNALTDLSTLPRLPSLRHLDAGKGALTSTKGIGNAPNLRSFSARENQIATLEHLGALRRLNELDLSENQVRDLAEVASLDALEELNVHSNALRDLTPLRANTRLRKLRCFGNDGLSKGLSELCSLSFLESIEAVSWKVSPKEVAAFVAARPDVELDLEGLEQAELPPVTDADRSWWASLAEHPELRAELRRQMGDEDRLSEEELDGKLAELLAQKHLGVECSGVRSLAPLSRLTALEYLDISDDPVEDLAPLAEMSNLRTLQAVDTLVRSVTPLSRLIKLDSLDLTRSKLASLEGLEGCPALSDLSITDTAVDSLAPLSKTRALTRISFDGTAVESLSPLAGHARLERVDLGATKVTDLSPLATCEALERIDCYALPGLRGLTALQELPNLAKVHSRGSLAPFELDAFRKARPDVEVD